MSDSTQKTQLADQLAVLRAREQIEKIKFGFSNRWPAGSSKGGQFAPKSKGGGIAAGDVKSTSGKPHPKVDDKGQPVTITRPTQASHQSTWSDPSAVATFTPGGSAPLRLNGVNFGSWGGAKDWSKVDGTNEQIDVDYPFEPTRGKSVGAGVVILEPDGRVWLTKPTNEFGGYANTYPKGTAESGLTLQQNAIKEAWEETGLKVKIVGLLGDYERTTSKARYYLAQRVGGTPSDMGWESQAIRLSPLKQARKLLNVKVDTDILDDIEHLMEISRLTKSSWSRQPRWPKGSALGGQWKTSGADGLTMPPVIAGGLAGSNAVYQKAVNGAHVMAQGGDLTGAQNLLSKYAAANEKFAAKQLASSHVKWGAQAHQYATQLINDATNKIKAEATADRIAGPTKLSSMTYSGAKPGGSNPGGLYTDASGAAWLVKGNKQLADGVQGLAVSNMRAANEVLAAKLLLAAGVGAPEMKLVDLQGQYGGGIGVASKMETGIETLKTSNAAHVAAAQNDFAVHAWLGNYDALGMGLDNTVIATATGKAINIDPGGALLFRAQGALKDPYTPLNGLKADAPEFETMRDTSPEQQAIYGKMSASQLAQSAEKLKNISTDQITNLVNTYGPGDQKMKDALAQRLVERKDAILAKAAALQPAPEPPKQPSQKSIKDVANEGIVAAKATVEKNIAANPNYIGPSGLGDSKRTMKFFIGTTNYVQGHAGLANYLEQAWAAKDLQAVATAVALADQLKKTHPGKASDAIATIAGEKMLALAYEEVVAAKKILDSAPKIEVPEKPVFSTAIPKADRFYAGMADGFAAMHASGNLSALKAAATSGKYDGATPWKPGTPNGMKIAAYHAALVASLEQKEAAGIIASAQAADKALTAKPVTTTPPPKARTSAKVDDQLETLNPPMPNFQSAFMEGNGGNALSNNKKVAAIKALAEQGDVKGLLSLAYGSNTYGKKHVTLANDALAALGSTHKVAASQKAGTHPALTGGATPAEVAAAAAAVKAFAPSPHQVIDGASPSAKAKFAKTTIASAIAAIDQSLPPKPAGTIVSQLPHHETLGYWIALGKVAAFNTADLPKQSALSPKAKRAAKEKFKSAPAAARKFIIEMQKTGDFATAYRTSSNWNEQKYEGTLLSDMAAAALEYATEHKPGTTLYRWSRMEITMREKLLKAEPGTVFQATGPMPSSFAPTASTKFGRNRMEIIFAPGAKAVDSFGSGLFGTEKEVTILPNSRFVLLESRKIEGGYVDIKVLMLPPDYKLKKDPTP